MLQKFWPYLFCFIVLITLFGFVIQLAKPKDNTPSSNVSSHFEQSASSNPDESKTTTDYLVKESNGKIVIYRVGENEPFRELDFWVNALPEADQQALEEGILLHDDTTLAQLIEDYTG